MTVASSASIGKRFQAFLDPAPAWIVILGFSFFTAVCLIAGLGKVLNFAFPTLALVVGIFLYFRAPILYNGFSWWMWFLAPLVRRLADFRSGFSDPSAILFAPYLVALVTLITFFKNLPKAHRVEGIPFVLAATGIFYAFAISSVNNQDFFRATRGFLDWVVPIPFGFHLLINWRNYPAYRRNIQTSFAWGVLVMGIYGIFQSISLPEWDRSWLINTGLISGAGDPDSVNGARVWSTMQSAEPFAAFMSAALLVLLTKQNVVGLPASAVGYLSLLLSTVRSAWIGWAGGFLILASTLRVKYQIRLLILAIVMLLCVVPLTAMEPFSQKINDRFATFSNLQEDNSGKGRQEFFKDQIGPALTSVVGNGISGSSYDNTILAALFDLGWFGTLPYIAGLITLLIKVFQKSGLAFDPFISTARAVAVSVLVRLPVNGSLFGVSGVLIWSFLALALAAKQYHRAHQDSSLPSVL